MNFAGWYETHEWFHDPEPEMKAAWDALVAKGFSQEETADLLDSVISSIRTEYGD